MVTRVRHPIFARVYARIADAAEKAGAAEHRDEVLADLEGRVVEVGAGTGLNFSHYPSSVEEVVAVEPEPHLRHLAEDAARRSSVPVRVVDGTAEALPLESASVDAGVVSLVLCSVRDQGVALAELYRVIRPGGQLRFYEHVRSEDSRRAKLQDRIDLVWPCFGGGCHPNRQTFSAIESAGFVVDHHRSFDFQPCFISAPVAPHVMGVAVRPITG
jgi:ubiquinone/menaquinone biosynthesis C-methylase UbiE